MRTNLPLLFRSVKPSQFLFWVMAALLFSTCFSATVLAQTGLHYTPEEVAVWRNRATATSGTTNYRVSGDVPNYNPAGGPSYSPGDWSRIITNANNFVNNTNNARTIDRWSAPVPSATGCITQGSAYGPDLPGRYIKDAAMAYLITGNTIYSNAVKAELLRYVNNDTLNFNNTALWCRCNASNNPNDSGGHPFFIMSEWLAKLLNAYDYTKSSPSYSSADTASIKLWFTGAGNFFQHLLNGNMNRYFGVDERCSTSGLVDATRLSDDANGTVTRGIDMGFNPIVPLYYGGKEVWSAKAYNNRRCNVARFIGLAGVFLNDGEMKKTAKIYFHEWLKFGVYDTGDLGEMSRAFEDNDPERGLNYAFSSTGSMIDLADAFARDGDVSLYNYSTTIGICTNCGPGQSGSTNTAGGPKSLKLVIQNLQKYLNEYRTSNQKYATLDPSQLNNTYLIDGANANGGDLITYDVWFSIANNYYKDAVIQENYLRKPGGTRPYPQFPKGVGPNIAWGGQSGIYPGVLFMFGQMENSPASPYRLKITWPANNTSFSAGSSIPITVDASKVYNISGVEYYQIGASTPFLTSSVAPYNVTWNGALPGIHKIIAKPVSPGTPSTLMPYSDTLQITVNPCTATGTILREFWANVPGDTIVPALFNTPPTSSSQMPSFQGPLPGSGFGIADNYASRYRGYLCAPATGTYTFWICSDNDGQLWLSSDRNPANKSKIAYIKNGFAYANQWTKYATQVATVYLIAGQSYYIEALHKEGTGGDQLQVAWRLPGSTAAPTIIPGTALSPFIPDGTIAGARTTAQNLADAQLAADRSGLNVFPNPSKGKVFVDFTTKTTAHASKYASVNVYDMWGNQVYTLFEGNVNEGITHHLEMDSQHLSSGVYIIRLVTSDQVTLQKIVITK